MSAPQPLRFSRPQQFIVTSLQQICLFLAGVGSGKTHIIGFLSGYFIKNFPSGFGFIGANTYKQLTQSTLFRVKEVWKEVYGWEEGVDYVDGERPPRHFNREFHNFKKYDGIISFKNGAVVFIGSLENAKAHDGKEFAWAFLDETKDTREEDVKEIILARLRMLAIYLTKDNQLTTEAEGPDGEEHEEFNPLYILTSPAKVRWINEWFQLDNWQAEIVELIHDKTKFFKKEFKDKCVVISSTYHNAKNLPKKYIKKLLDNNTVEGGKRLIYGNPFVKAGGEFYSGFERIRHVKKVQYDPSLPLHLSFDQNRVPYNTCTYYQIAPHYKILDKKGNVLREVTQVRQLGEICLPNPHNTTEKLALEVDRKLMKMMGNGVYIYGDPAGRHKSTRSLENDYGTINRILRKYINNRSDRVPYKHPSVPKRKDFINNAFEDTYDIEILIDPSCKNSIADFEFVKEDPNGKKLKENFKDKDKGITYEKYGHTSDSFDYFFTKAFERLFLKYFK